MIATGNCPQGSWNQDLSFFAPAFGSAPSGELTLEFGADGTWSYTGGYSADAVPATHYDVTADGSGRWTPSGSGTIDVTGEFLGYHVVATGGSIVAPADVPGLPGS